MATSTLTELEDNLLRNIGQLLIAAHSTQTAIVVALDLDKGAVSKRLNGQRPFRLPEVQRIADHFAMPDPTALFLPPLEFRAWLDRNPKYTNMLTRRALDRIDLTRSDEDADLRADGTRCSRARAIQPSLFDEPNDPVWDADVINFTGEEVTTGLHRSASELVAA